MYYDRLRQRVRAAKAADRQRREALAMLDGVDVTQHIAEVYKPIHADIAANAHTVFNLPGGRGSCKSSFVSLEIVNGIMRDTTGQSNAIVFRVYANTLRESVYSQIAWAIDVLGVNHLWKGQLAPMRYTYTPTGAQILFRGLDDPSKLKSIKPQKGYFRFVWLEEFSEIPGPNFLRNVMQSVQRGGDAFTIFRSFNPPISRNNWANVFIQEPDPRAVTLLTNYTEVPPEWLGEAFIAEAERLKAVNPQAYQHEYMGLPVGNGSEVFPNIEAREITDAEIKRMEYVYQGLDFGFAQDPLAFIRAGYDRQREQIYLLDEIFARGMSNKALSEAIKNRGYDRTGVRYSAYNDEPALITCDCAEPKSIVDLRDLGLYARGCHKEPGCVEYRTKWLQHRQIIIDPRRTPNAYREFTNYSYQVDKDGNVTSQLIDRDNHTVDALSYALDHQIYWRNSPA